MSSKFNFWILLSLFTVSVGFCSAQDMTDSATGKSFPQTVSFDYQGKTLNLSGTGVSTRKKFFVKVYSVASYIEDPSSVKGDDVFNNILNSKSAKQLSFQWVRNVKANKVQEGYRQSLGKVTSNAAHIVKFADFFGDVKSGDKHTIRWLPDGTLTVSINGEEKGKMQNEQFAKDVWSVWFGKSSVVDRNKLVSQLR